MVIPVSHNPLTAVHSADPPPRGAVHLVVVHSIVVHWVVVQWVVVQLAMVP